MSEKRNTWQKQVIYSVIKELKTHPTVQSLIDELEKRGYKIGKSTVYRVLSYAVDEGIVMNVYSGDKIFKAVLTNYFSFSISNRNSSL